MTQGANEPGRNLASAFLPPAGLAPALFPRGLIPVDNRGVNVNNRAS